MLGEAGSVGVVGCITVRYGWLVGLCKCERSRRYVEHTLRKEGRDRKVIAEGAWFGSRVHLDEAGDLAGLLEGLSDSQVRESDS